MKYHVLVYGCQMNYSDAARIKAVLNNGGWEYVDEIEQAEIVIIDTCSVRQKSEDKVRGQIKELSKKMKSDEGKWPLIKNWDGSQMNAPPKGKQTPKVWLTWCMIQHNLNLKKTQTAKSKKYQLGNFVGTVEINTPLIVGKKALDEDEQLKLLIKELALEKNDRRAEILYINHAFDPFFAKMQRTFPIVELFFRIDDVGMLPFILKAFGYSLKNDGEVTNEYMGIIPHDANFLQKQTKTAFVPISTGCSQFCSYCIVPYARGLEKNRAVEEILEEVKVHLKQGVEEITLLGQIVNKHPQFYEILKAVSELPWVKWLRYTSPYPTFYDERIFALHEEKENICPHIHIPVQSGSNKVLKKMFRGYTVEQFKNFIDTIRALKRPISITTDIIVWFCDETEEDFQKSMELIHYSRFDMVYIGIYSQRPGTYGARKYEDNIPLSTKKRRHEEMTTLLREVSVENNKNEIGQVREIMISSIDTEKGIIMGYTDNMKNVIIPMESDGPPDNRCSTCGTKRKLRGIDEIKRNAATIKHVEVGEFVEVKIVDRRAFSLEGKLSCES